MATETNAERLERIKAFELGANHFIDPDVQWLIEQAERAQESEDAFEKLLKDTATVDGQYATLHREWRNQGKEIDRLREALEKVKEDLIPLSGVNSQHTNCITDICIGITQVLIGESYEDS